MKIPLAIAAIGLFLLAFRWALPPSGRVPRFRVMVTRLRLRAAAAPRPRVRHGPGAVAAPVAVRQFPPVPPGPPVAAGLASGYGTRPSTACSSGGHSTGTGCGWRSRNT